MPDACAPVPPDRFAVHPDDWPLSAFAVWARAQDSRDPVGRMNGWLRYTLALRPEFWKRRPAGAPVAFAPRSAAPPPSAAPIYTPYRRRN